MQGITILQDAGGGSHAHPDTMWANEVKAFVKETFYYGSYKYDKNGNRTEANKKGEVHTYQYDNENRLTQELIAALGKTITYGYDNNGNQTSRVEDGLEESFLYDHANRMRGYTRKEFGTVKSSWSYLYTPLGQRLNKYNMQDKTAEWYMYDGDDVIADYAQGASGGMYRANSYVNELGIDSKVARITSNNDIYYYIPDALGSVHQLVDEDADIVNRQVTTAWGEDIVFTQAMPDRYGFTQRERDGESMLIYSRARTLMPSPWSQAETRVSHSYSRFCYPAKLEARCADPDPEFFAINNSSDAL